MELGADGDDWMASIAKTASFEFGFEGNNRMLGIKLRRGADDPAPNITWDQTNAAALQNTWGGWLGRFANSLPNLWTLNGNMMTAGNGNNIMIGGNFYFLTVNEKKLLSPLDKMSFNNRNVMNAGTGSNIMVGFGDVNYMTTGQFGNLFWCPVSTSGVLFPYWGSLGTPAGNPDNTFLASFYNFFGGRGKDNVLVGVGMSENRIWGDDANNVVVGIAMGYNWSPTTVAGAFNISTLFASSVNRIRVGIGNNFALGIASNSHIDAKSGNNKLIDIGFMKTEVTVDGVNIGTEIKDASGFSYGAATAQSENWIANIALARDDAGNWAYLNIFNALRPGGGGIGALQSSWFYSSTQQTVPLPPDVYGPLQPVGWVRRDLIGVAKMGLSEGHNRALGFGTFNFMMDTTRGLLDYFNLSYRIWMGYVKFDPNNTESASFSNTLFGGMIGNGLRNGNGWSEFLGIGVFSNAIMLGNGDGVHTNTGIFVAGAINLVLGGSGNDDIKAFTFGANMILTGAGNDNALAIGAINLVVAADFNIGWNLQQPLMRLIDNGLANNVFAGTTWANNVLNNADNWGIDGVFTQAKQGALPSLFFGNLFGGGNPPGGNATITAIGLLNVVISTAATNVITVAGLLNFVFTPAGFSSAWPLVPTTIRTQGQAFVNAVNNANNNVLAAGDNNRRHPARRRQQFRGRARRRQSGAGWPRAERRSARGPQRGRCRQRRPRRRQ